MGIYESKKCVEYFSFVYRELAYFYGMTIVNVEERPKEIVNRIDQLIETRAFEEIRSMGLKSMQLEKIRGRHIETQIISQLNQSQC